MSAPTKRFWKSIADIDWEIKRLEQEIRELEIQRAVMVSQFSTTANPPMSAVEVIKLREYDQAFYEDVSS